MPSGHLILHQNQNQAVWAVKSHPVLRGSRAFKEMCGRCVLPKNHYTHLAHVSPGRGTNFSSVKEPAHRVTGSSFGTCVTENNVVTCPHLSRQAAVRVYLHQGPLEQQLWGSYPRESSLASCKAAQVQLLLNRDLR